jgi:non-specific serine/threonine protein kinase
MDERDRRRPLADAPIAFEMRIQRRPDQARPSAFRMVGAAGRRHDPARRWLDLARTATAAERPALSSRTRGRLHATPAAHPKRMTDAHRFDRYEVSLATRQLLVDGRPAPLGGRTFDLLLALVEHRDRVLCKDELLQLVWPGLVVEENNLQVHVSKLRKVLGTDAIATVPGFGYRFALDPDPARFVAAQPRRTRGNLPAPLTSFVGRDVDLRDVKSRLGTSRLVTLTGAGGMGKSRLAAEVARRAAEEFADGAWVVDMAPLADGRRVADVAAAALRVPRDPAISALDAFARHAALREFVLVLDNCEHVLPECAQLARRLL